MQRNEQLNNTCILFDKDNIAQQEAIIRFYNDNGWYSKCGIYDEENCIGVYEGYLDYWYYRSDINSRLKVIDLPKEYYPIDSIVEDVKSERMYTEKQILELFKMFDMDLPFNYEFLIKNYLQLIK